MNYWDGQQWSPSDASFDLTDDAFVANRVQHRTRLNADLNVIGAVTTTLVDGTTLRSTPVAIALYDPNDGRFAVVSTITNSIGVLVASNQVVYPDAFSGGGVCANVVYTLQAGSFEQDIVITGRLNPVDYGFPTNAQIQIITEFYDPPQPEKMRRPIYVEQKESVRRRKVSPDLMDDVLGFSDLVIGTGRAFTPPTATHTNGAQTVVAKEFRTIPEEGRTFLIETVNCLSIQKALNALPECGGARTAQRIHNRSDGYALVPRPTQTTQATKAKPQKSPNQLAQANTPTRSGVVIDYVATLSGTLSGTTVFKGDTTYLVLGTVYCNGPVTLEAAVFKHKVGTSIVLNNSLTCKTSSYRPAVFTCIDDDSIGESLAGYPGYTGTINPAGYGNPALCSQWSSTPSLSNVRFCYAQEAIRLVGTYVSATLSHAQIINCIRGIVLVNGGSDSGSGSGSGDFSITVNNALLSFVNYALIKSTDYGSGSGSGPAAYAYLYNCTVDHSQVLANEDYVYPYFPVTFKNSILANIGSLGNASLANSTYNGFYSCPLFGNPASRWTSSTDPFQVSWGGAYYLKADSSFRSKGATTVPTTLLSSLKVKTTQPPMAFSRFTEVFGELTLFPQVPRYVSGPPDLGYWYDALDYTVASMWLEGGSITVQPGTAIGFRNEYAPDFFWPWYWTLEGLELWEGSSFISHGMPTRPIVYADVQTVQEQAGLATAAFFVPWFILDPNNTPPPIADFRFSNFYAAPGATPGYIYLSYFQDPASYASPGTFHFWSGLDELGDALSVNSTLNLTLRDCSLQGGAVNLGKDLDFVMNLPCNVSWINSLFDRVDFNLDPDWVDQSDPTLYVDLTFQGYNNLFRGGLLRAVPIPATAGNWIFKDNLFDKIAFEQDTTASLDHDFNGYWKRLPSELESGQTDRLAPNAANDKVLTSAPYYQSGPLGSYYLPASGLLYNGGSRTPGQAGLYHYTTRIDQTKDGVETPSVVNIGLHYVATVSYSSTQPKDTDSDGIPDWIEDADGDGVWDTPDPLRFTQANNDFCQVDQNSAANVLSVLVNDFDSEGFPLSILSPYGLAATGHGTVQPAQDYRSLLYTPTSGFSGVDSFSYVIFNGFNRAAIGTVNVFVNQSGNHLPVAVTDVGVMSATTITLNLLANDSDPDSDTISIVSLESPRLGTVQNLGGGQIQYTRAASVFGPDVFHYTITDGRGACAVGTVRIERNLGLLANHDTIQIEQDSGNNELDLLRNDQSFDGFKLAVSSVTTPTHGTAAVASGGVKAVYSPNNGFYGADSFTYTAADGHGDNANATVRIFVNKSGNSPPVAGDDNYTLAVNEHSVDLGALGNDTDPDSDPLAIHSIIPPVKGTATDIGGGQIRYVRDPAKFGDDSFAYIVTDGNGGYAIGHVLIEQIDQDGDLMPDEWELAHNLDPMTPDDAALDPDNDGLPHIAEFWLHTNPQVADNPLGLATIDLPAVLSGTVTIPLNVSSGVEREDLSLSLLVDGNPANTSIQKTAGDLWFAQWDTSAVPNGTRTLSLKMVSTLRSGDASLYYPVVGSARSVSVFNAVTLAPLSKNFTAFLPIEAKANVPANFFRIEVYDTANGNHLKTLAGAVSYGMFASSWDLLDDQGVQTTARSLTCEYYLSASGAPAGPPAATTQHSLSPPIQGQAFVVAYGFDYSRQSMQTKLQDAIRRSVVENLNTLWDMWGPGTDYDLLPSANVPYGNAFQWWGGFWQDYSTLTNALADSSAANFYWWGHGGPDVIVPWSKPKPPYLRAQVLRDLLGNLALDHPYRLVILDGCNTYSQEWAEAFGIDFDPAGNNNTVQNFISRGLNPQAFVGWVVETPAPNIPAGVEYFEDSLFYLWAYWQLGYPLKDCLQQYTYYLVDVHGFNADGNWLGIGANGIPDLKEYKISGCRDLTTFDR